MVMTKYSLEGKLHEEHQLIKDGVLKEENPLDQSNEFNQFLFACRLGDLRKCQELINKGVNINGKDKFDYTPLIIASLCGHYELVRLLLEAGALAERNTFQGERCIYNALNDRIRNLLLQYDFSKSSDPYVYWSSHITALLDADSPRTSDMTLTTFRHRSFAVHKFLLSARSPYFRKKLAAHPDAATWKLAAAIPDESLHVVLRHIYLGGAVPRDLSLSDTGTATGGGDSDEEILAGVGRISKQLEVEHLWAAILDGGDRRLARQRYQDEVGRALEQVREFFEVSVLGHKMVVDTDRVHEVCWPHGNSIFADALLRADEPDDEDERENLVAVAQESVSPPCDHHGTTPGQPSNSNTNSIIPIIGPALDPPTTHRARRSVLYPVHRAMLVRSDYFRRMFSGDFIESRRPDDSDDDSGNNDDNNGDKRLRVITVDCRPAVLELVLAFLYTEQTVCPLEHALELLYVADMLFLDALKTRAAVAISTLGSSGRSNNHNHSSNHNHNSNNSNNSNGDGPATEDVEPINIYDVMHAAWDLGVRRLEEFAARYLADRLEDYIDDPDFDELIRQSAARIRRREATDTIELLDDIRYHLSERFRLRFQDAGLDDVMGAQDEDDGEDKGRREGEGVETMSAADYGQAVATAVEADDEFASDAINYQVLLDKIDGMLDRLNLDA